MSSANIKISIDSKDKDKQLYSYLKVIGHIEEKDLQNTCENMRSVLSLKAMPFLVMELPEQLQQYTIPTFNKDTFTHEKLVKDGKVYHWGNLKNKENNLFLKKIQKLYHLLTGLNNQCWINFGFFDIQNLPKKINLQDYENGYKHVCTLLDGIKIQGKINLDDKTISTFKQLTEKISPQFNESPIMLFLELIETCEINLQLDNFSFLQEEFLKQMLNMRFKEDPDDKILPVLRSSPQTMRVFITMPNLFSIQIEVPCELIGTLLSFL